MTFIHFLLVFRGMPHVIHAFSPYFSITKINQQLCCEHLLKLQESNNTVNERTPSTKCTQRCAHESLLGTLAEDSSSSVDVISRDNDKQAKAEAFQPAFLIPRLPRLLGGGKCLSHFAWVISINLIKKILTDMSEANLVCQTIPERYPQIFLSQMILDLVC